VPSGFTLADTSTTGSRGPIRLQARLGARGPQDRLVEAFRRLLQLEERATPCASWSSLRLLGAAGGAADDVGLYLLDPLGRKLAVREVEQQVLGLGAVHALPSRTPGGGSASASSAVTPTSASALRNPDSA